MQTIDELLEEIDVFRRLADEHLDLIAGCALTRAFAAGEALLTENEQANSFYAIRQGTVGPVEVEQAQTRVAQAVGEDGRHELH